MASPFAAYGISHVSASQLTTFASDPSRWFAQKVLGYRAPSSAAMERGKAVEYGVARYFLGDDLAGCIEAAEASFDKACKFGVLGDVDVERHNVGQMVAVGINALSGLGTPEFPEDGGQHKIEVPIRFGTEPDDVIPIIGYLDFVFPDRIIDLKSTTRIPSEMSFAHKIQAAIYARTTNKAVQFVYVSTKKTEFHQPPNIAEAQENARAIVRRMAAFLSLSADKEILRNAVPVIADSFAWRGEEDARRSLYGM